MGTKAIFLDIDGVLNNFGSSTIARSKSRCGNYIGIDKDKTQRLAHIVDKTNAILILTSSWKVGWEPYGSAFYTSHSKYLNNHLRKKGNLKITDKTKERNLALRGMGIKAYLMSHPEITNWIVIDDEIFPDFEKYHILSHLIKTDPVIGLTDNDAEDAINLLNGKKLQHPRQLLNCLAIVTNKKEGPSDS